MKSKTEKKIDEEIEQFGIFPHIYHFREAGHKFNAITIVTTMPYSRTNRIIEDVLEEVCLDNFSPATRVLEILREEWHICGVAICDNRDDFNRQIGRTIAKGRLLKHLKSNM